MSTLRTTTFSEWNRWMFQNGDPRMRKSSSRMFAERLIWMRCGRAWEPGKRVMSRFSSGMPIEHQS